MGGGFWRMGAPTAALLSIIATIWAVMAILEDDSRLAASLSQLAVAVLVLAVAVLVVAVVLAWHVRSRRVQYRDLSARIDRERVGVVRRDTSRGLPYRAGGDR